MREVKKIVIIGPESTGKSTLCTLLADHYKTIWCPEYAREYLLTNGTNYNYDDLLTIAKGQLALEDEYLEKVKGLGQWVKGNDVDGKWLTVIEEKEGSEHNELPKGSQASIENRQLLFVDTDMYVMKVWCEFVFGKCHQFILDKIFERVTDLYLLCDIDLPWVKDELREYPDYESRKKLYHIYKDILINQKVSWVNIRGDYKERLHLAITAIDDHFFRGPAV